MANRYFGTDGIRGQANIFPMTPKMALKAAMATALILRRGAMAGHRSRAVIGKDTRLSGYMIEQAMASGFVAMGVDVILVGPVPTPAVAMLTRSMRADVGVMISASHNPFQDNGIKLFGHDGFKLPDALERDIEDSMDRDLDGDLAAPESVGKASRLDDATGRYIEFIKAGFTRRHSLSGLKIVLDCAHGAAYKVAPQILWELEADVIRIGTAPDGKNINAGCGATDTALLQRTVLAEGADLGIALDGDADRLIMVDETGTRIDGDQLMAALATDWAARGKLAGGALVATIMSNLGLETYLQEQGIRLIRTAVGDRHVVEAMRAHGCNLGGEQSGHLIMTDFGTTGDGLLAALRILVLLKDQDKPASRALNVFTPLPQILRAVSYARGTKPLESPRVIAAIQEAESHLAPKGRILVRPSGTEPVIRVMAEGEDTEELEKTVKTLCDCIAQDCA